METPDMRNADWNETTHCTGFDGDQQVATGVLREVAARVKQHLDRRGEGAAVLIFDDLTAQQIELDFRGTVQDVLSRLPKATPTESGATSPDTQPDTQPELPGQRGPGRPKLGVVAREVTLLPRHWEWLSAQPGGASVALRRLVESARLASAGADRRRQSQESAYRFMSALAGDRPGFEEASRALFAGNAESFAQHTSAWPADIRNYLNKLARDAMGCGQG